MKKGLKNVKDVMIKIAIIIVIGILIIGSLSIYGCEENNKDFGQKPKDIDEPMPEIWEEKLSGKGIDENSFGNLEELTEITIGADITDIDIDIFAFTDNLENIYVEEGNKKFVSDEGVLYSKSYQTLYRWPLKKPVTSVRDSVKYFAPNSFGRCNMPEDFEIPDGTITIGAGTFAGTDLKKLHIKENVRAVGNWKYSELYYGGWGYRGIYPETCKEVEISAPIVYASFYSSGHYGENYLDYSIETIIFNEGVKQIRPNRDKNLEPNYKDIMHKYKMIYAKRIEFPSTLEAIGNVSFPVNVNVENYILPENIVYLAKNAFDDYYAKLSFSCSCVSYKPIIIKREVSTQFICKSQVAIDYVEAKMPIWEEHK